MHTRAFTPPVAAEKSEVSLLSLSWPRSLKSTHFSLFTLRKAGGNGEALARLFFVLGHVALKVIVLFIHTAR